MARDPYAGGAYTVDLVRVRTTKYTLTETDSAQLQALVSNNTDETVTVTVEWLFGEHSVAAAYHTLSPDEEHTFAKRVYYGGVENLAPGDYSLTAKLVGNRSWSGQTVSYGTMHLEAPGSTGGGGSGSGSGSDEEPNQAGDCPSGYYWSEAFGQCLPTGAPSEDDEMPDPDAGSGSGSGSGSEDEEEGGSDGLALLPAFAGFSSTQVTLGALALVGLAVVAR